MRWLSVLSRQKTLDACWEECLQALPSGERPDLVLVFVSPDLSHHYDRLSSLISENFPGATVLGCSGSGLIGGGEEAEFCCGLSLTLAWLPGVRLKSFQLRRPDLPDLDAAPDRWRTILVGEQDDLRGLLLVANPYTFPGDELLAGLDYAYPSVVKLGGLAGGHPTAGNTALFATGGVCQAGVVGLGLFGDVRMDAVVAQGCRPIGKPMVVTDCSHNEIGSLDNRLAGDAVLAVLRDLSPRDQRLASQLLFLGIGAGGPKLTYGPGDFLIRQVLGVNPDEHSLVVNAQLRKGQTVQLHLRDHRSSSDDLEAMLDQHLAQREQPAQGAVLFSCVGRGRSLYGHGDHDSDLFRTKLGDVPLGGFFCAGELGPVGGQTSQHGFTSCFAIFSQV